MIRTPNLALFCLEAPATAEGSMMYMPAGIHTITPSCKGKPVQVRVRVDAAAAQDLERQRRALVASGRKPFFDFGHKDEEASFWPAEFYWQADGVHCHGEWSSAGKAAIEGKLWRQFSPVFHVDDLKANPARVVCCDQASPNMGGLVNNPAFKAIAPLFSQEATHDYDPADLRALNQRLTKLIAGLNTLLR